MEFIVQASRSLQMEPWVLVAVPAVVTGYWKWDRSQSVYLGNSDRSLCRDGVSPV